MQFISFTSPTELARTLLTGLNSSGDSWPLCVAPDLSEEVSTSNHKLKLCKFLLDTFIKKLSL